MRFVRMPDLRVIFRGRACIQRQLCFFDGSIARPPLVDIETIEPNKENVCVVVVGWYRIERLHVDSNAKVGAGGIAGGWEERQVYFGRFKVCLGERERRRPPPPVQRVYRGHFGDKLGGGRVVPRLDEERLVFAGPGVHEEDVQAIGGGHGAGGFYAATTTVYLKSNGANI